MVLCMVNDLPEHSRFRARWFQKYGAEMPEPEPSNEIDWYTERREWGSTDRILAAAQVNKLSEILKYAPMWDKGKGPEVNIVGPAEWRDKSIKDKTEKRSASVTDVMQVLGWAG